MLKDKKLGFIGGGNMAEAIIKGLIAGSFVDSSNISVSDVVPARLESLRLEYKVNAISDNRELVEKSDILILAVKPQVVKTVLENIRDLMNENILLVSVAAGVPIATIAELLQDGQDRKHNIVRTMPNTPALVLEGVTAIAAGENVSEADVEVAHRLFEAVGKTVQVDEAHLDAVTGLSGSGPAYIFMIIEALSDAGVKMGLSREVANTLTIQTVLGSAKLAGESKKHPGQLKDMVTSPGGTTISGVHMLEAGGLRNTLMDAVEAATKRSRELGKNA